MLFAVVAFARVTSFQDVKCVYREDPNQEAGKKDGMMHFDPVQKVLSFSSDNRVLVHIRFESVTKIDYQSKSGRLLTIYFKDMREEPHFAQFHLDGGNRDNILATVESQLGHTINRIN